MSTDYNEIPIPTIKRLPSYLRLLKAYREEGMEMISATLLADELGLKPIQVRKDISCTGIEGKPKVGFSVNGLIDAIIEALGWDNATDAILVVPAEHAQAVADQVVGYGIRAIWNFAPKDLKLDEDVVVQRTDLATSFAVLSAQVKLRLDQKKHRSGSDTW